MGKENLIYRPGRASGERIIETPNAQLLKKMEFNFGFTTYQGDINDANIDTLAKQYNTNIDSSKYHNTSTYAIRNDSSDSPQRPYSPI